MVTQAEGTPRSQGEFWFDASDLARIRQRINELRAETREILELPLDPKASRDDIVASIRKRLTHSIVDAKETAANELKYAEHFYGMIYSGLVRGNVLVVRRDDDGKKLPNTVDVFRDRGFSVQTVVSTMFVKGELVKDFLKCVSPEAGGSVLRHMEGFFRDGFPLTFVPVRSPHLV